jgi:hypothetical protein
MILQLEQWLISHPPLFEMLNVLTLSLASRRSRTASRRTGHLGGSIQPARAVDRHLQRLVMALMLFLVMVM